MTDKKTDFKSLASGGGLTKESWDDFVKRLNDGVRGAGVDDHCTSDAIFLVQEQVIVTGIDRDYTDELVAMDCENDYAMYFEGCKWWDELDEDDQEEILQKSGCEDFSKLTESEQWDLMEEYSGFTVTGYSEQWKTVNSHLTKEAAEAFIARKKHDYRELRVYVDSRYWCWEFRSVIDGILDGKIKFSD